MPSQIDDTKPVPGNPTTESVRTNFTVAKLEISDLQDNTQDAPFLPLSGARMAGPMYLFNDPTDVMMPATKGYVDAGGGGGGGGGIPEAPSGEGFAYGRFDGSWQPVLRLVGGSLSGPLSLAGTTPSGPLEAVSKGYVDGLIPVVPPVPGDGRIYGRTPAEWVAVLPLAGAQMTGPILLSGDATQPTHPVTLRQFQAGGFLPLTGGSLSGNLIIASPNTLSMGNAVYGPNGVSFVGSLQATIAMFTGVCWLYINSTTSNTTIPYSAYSSGLQYNVTGWAVNTPLTSANATLGQGAGSISWGVSTSDRRLKRNVVPAGDALAVVNAIPIYAADQISIATGQPALHLDFAMIADEVEEHLPCAYLAPVRIELDPQRAGQVDEKGYAGLHPLYLITTLWRAVQQLAARVQAMEAQ